MLTFCDSFCSQYHGNLLGFENLYILDSSTDTRCISFLRYARDSLGVNVLFTDVNLNQLESITTKIGKDICGSSDLILKMDIEVVFTRGVSLSHSMNTCIHVRLVILYLFVSDDGPTSLFQTSPVPLDMIEELGIPSNGLLTPHTIIHSMMANFHSHIIGSLMPHCILLWNTIRIIILNVLFHQPYNCHCCLIIRLSTKPIIPRKSL